MSGSSFGFGGGAGGGAGGGGAGSGLPPRPPLRPTSALSSTSVAPQDARRLSSAPEDRLWAYLNDNTGVRVPEDQNYFFESRLRRIMLTHQLKDLGALVDIILGQGPSAAELRDKVVDALMTHETSFFRNPEVFQKLQSLLIPELTARYPGPAELRVWSAASSTGQEAVSLSILLSEHLRGRSYSIFGSDIGVGTVEKAKSYLYSVLETNRGLSAAQLKERFEREGAGFKVSAPIRAPISYKVHNLLEPLMFVQPFHLVMLRNVLVYFDEASRLKAFENVARVTLPGSVVVLGTGEQLLNVPEHLFSRHVEDRVAWLRRK